MNEPDNPNQIAIAPGVALPDAALTWSFARGGGPGGQNVNKVNTRATLTVLVADLAPLMPSWAVDRLRELAGQKLAAEPERLVITSAESRSQIANRENCLEKLRELVVQALHRPRRRKKTRPSRAAKQRRLEAKKQRGQRKAQRGQDWAG